MVAPSRVIRLRFDVRPAKPTPRFLGLSLASFSSVFSNWRRSPCRALRRFFCASSAPLMRKSALAAAVYGALHLRIITHLMQSAIPLVNLEPQGVRDDIQQYFDAFVGVDGDSGSRPNDPGITQD